MSNMTYIRSKLIPALTSNTGNEDFKITSSALYNSQAYQIFDNDASTFVTTNATGEKFIKIEMSDEHYINGLLVISKNATPVYEGDWELYTSINGTSWTKVVSFATLSTPGEKKEIIFPKRKCKYIRLVSISETYAAIAEINFYEATEYYAVKQGGVYYSFNPAQYDTTTNMFKSFSKDELLANLDKEGYLAEKYYFTTDMTFGEETFKPIDKFDNFQLISTKAYDNYIYGLKSNREMVLGDSDFSARISRHIDYFEPEYTISGNAHIKMAVSIDSGVTWKTTADNGVTWTDVVTDTDLSIVKNEAWNAAMNSIFESGFNITNLKNIDFNTLTDKLTKLRFAYVFDLEHLSDEAVSKILKWQFDAMGTMNLQSKDEVNVSIAKDEIRITPKKDIETLQVNVGTGGAITVNQTVGTEVEEVSSEDIQSMINEVWK